MSSGRNEHRQHRRIGYVTAVQAIWVRKKGQTAVNKQPITLTTHDYSEGGLGFFYPKPIAVGDQLRVTFERPDGEATEATVEIRHCHKVESRGYLVGGQFID